MARAAYVTRETAAPAVREIMEKIEANGWPVLNIFRMVLRSPSIGPAFLRMGNAILEKSDLSPRLRELAILRVGHLTRAHYEWVQHVEFGLKCGVSQAQIDAIAQDRIAADAFSEEERAVLRFTDEVTRDIKASDAAFEALRRHLSEQLVVELTITIGFYNMVSRILETMEVELES